MKRNGEGRRTTRRRARRCEPAQGENGEQGLVQAEGKRLSPRSFFSVVGASEALDSAFLSLSLSLFLLPACERSIKHIKTERSVLFFV